MVVYKQSDVKLSWETNGTTSDGNAFPKVCGYVKEGAGEWNLCIWMGDLS